jgi:hypothetical protein
MTAVRDFFVAMALLAGSPALSDAGDWIFDSGPYTRSATTGKRVAQYQPLPKVDRIPFQQFFSEDGPHPFGMDWWYGDPYWYGGGNAGFDYGLSPEAWGGYPYGRSYIYPAGIPY